MRHPGSKGKGGGGKRSIIETSGSGKEGLAERERRPGKKAGGTYPETLTCLGLEA